MEKSKLFTRPFVTLACVNFLNALCYYLLLAEMTDYALTTYQVSYSTAALTVTAFVIGSLLTRLFFGGQIDRWGIRKSLFIGYGICLILVFFYFFQLGVVPLIILRFLHGSGFAIASTAAAAAVAIIVPADRRGEGISYFSLGIPLATGIGPFAAILLINLTSGYTALFVFTAIMCIACFAALPLVKMLPDAHPAGPPAAPKKKFTLSGFIQVAVLPLGAIILLVYVCYSGIMSFLITYAKDIGMADAAGYYFLVYAATIIVTRILTGRIIDKRGPHGVMFTAAFSLAVGYVVLATASTPAALLASAALIGFGVGNCHSTLQITTANIAPVEHMGRANATLYVCIDLGTSIGPVAIGGCIPAVGYTPTFLAIGAVALVAAGLYWLLVMNKRLVEDAQA